MKIEILHYKIFDKLAHTLNFRQAAKELNLSISVVSKKIKELETYYNSTLFYRNTRSVFLTETGISILPRIKELILIEDQIKTDLNTNYQFIGNLKIGIPFSFFESILDKVKLYTTNNENVFVEWKIGNYLNRLYDENFDAIIFCGTLPDGDFYAKKIGEWKKVVCASPDFLKSYGTPSSPKDLVNYQCLDHYQNFKSTWGISGKEYSINLKQKCSFSRLLTSMAINSLGIVYLPSFTVDDTIQKGELVEIFEKYTSQRFDIFLVSKKPFSESRKTQEILNMLL
ncbi:MULTISPECIES: LysR family transcriptional regulator [Francisella]|uniref:LysR family transcriptional regulator n=1 Tax=Francisella TaxID=262 RepID=UPI0011B4355E|nr:MULTISPECIES: LysR family transcriptional regulator [Francisella]